MTINLGLDEMQRWFKDGGLMSLGHSRPALSDEVADCAVPMRRRISRRPVSWVRDAMEADSRLSWKRLGPPHVQNRSLMRDLAKTARAALAQRATES